MKRTVLLLLLLCPTLILAQQQPQTTQALTNLVERVAAPTYSDRYCSGFLSKAEIGKGNYIVAALNSPNATQFAQDDLVFLQGSGYQEGQQFSIVRELRDPNRQPIFPGQAAAIAGAGQPYADLGRVRVLAIRGKTAVAVIEFSCSGIVPGDVLVPFQERPPVSYKQNTGFEQFPSAPASVVGRIVMAKEFDSVVGVGQKVYLNVGADKGVKVGDYFRAVRSYDPAAADATEAISKRSAYSEDTQKNPLAIAGATYAELPRHAIAEMVVLNVTPSSATAMITMSLEHINIGDTAELEGSAAATPQQ